jgi:hypothetical protein
VTSSARMGGHRKTSVGCVRGPQVYRWGRDSPKLFNVAAWQLFNLISSKILLRLSFVLNGREVEFDCPVLGIHQSLCGNCQKVCWQRIYFKSDLLTQALIRCLNNCFTLVNSPPICLACSRLDRYLSTQENRSGEGNVEAFSCYRAPQG